MEKCAANGVTDILEVKIGYDGIVVANSKATAPMKLSRQDLFLALGLLSSSPIANVQGSMDSNEVVMSRFMSELIQELDNLHPGVNISFVDTAPETFPAGIDSFPYNAFGFSQICIAGSESVSGTVATWK